MMRALSAVYAAAIYLFIALPVAVLVTFSLQAGRFPVPPFNGPSLKWYAAVLDDRRLTDALVNSLLVGVASSALAVGLGFLAAVALARHRPFGAGAVRGLIMAPLMVSYLIIAMGLLITFNAAGLPKSLLAAGLGHTVINLPLCFAIVYSQLSDDQATIERAARDLGAGPLTVLFAITAPMVAPALFAAFALSFTLSWDEFVIAYLLTRFDVTLPVEIWNLMRSGLNPKTNAVGTIVFAVSVVVVLLAEVWLRRAFGRRSGRAA